jgi:hypothetical protein
MSVTTLFFDKLSHSYYDSRGILYTSATSLVGRYCDKFVADDAAVIEAIERKVSIETVIKRYVAAANTGISIGNAEHDFMEENFKGFSYGEKESFEFNTEEIFDESYEIDYEALLESPLVKHKEFYDLIKALAFDGWMFYSEHRLFNVKYLVCGTSDLIAKKGKKIIIFDYKTCKDLIEFTSGYYETIKFGGLRIRSKYRVWQDKRMFGFLNHLQDCNGNKYSLQLSIYAKILELYKYKIVGCFLVHLKPVLDFDEVLDFQYKLLPLKYYKDEALKIFRDNVNRPILHKLQ